MSERLQLARTELARLAQSTDDQLLVLEALERKRKQVEFIKYWQATPRQAEIFKEFTDDIKIFGILGGNRSGKTEFGAFIAAAWAFGKDYFHDEPAWEYIQHLPIPEPPNNIWVVGLDFPTLRDVIWREKLRFGKNHPALIPEGQPRVTKTNDSDYQIFLDNGSIITGKSADSGREKFQGASVDLVWIDEEPESEIFDECYQRTVDCRGKILITLTPLTDIHSGVRVPWVFDLFEDAKKGKAKDVKFQKLSVMENPYVPKEEKVKLVEKWAGHPEEKARLFGDFVQRSGLVYPMWDAKVHCVKSFRIPQYWRRLVSIDPAATGVTACLWFAIEPGTNNLYLYREYYESNLTVSEHCKNLLVRNGGDPIDIWLIDPTWARQRNAETHKENGALYRENKIPVRYAEVGEDYGLNVSREYMLATVTPASRHPRFYAFDECDKFRWECEHYTWAFFGKGDNKGLSKEKPVKRNDHAMNAFQYLCAQRPKGGLKRELSADEKKAAVIVNSYT